MSVAVQIKWLHNVRTNMNWSSTQVPLWQIDCEEFRKVGRPFELRDVTTPEHEKFVEVFSVRHGLWTEREGTTVRFSQKSPLSAK
jgi:hypothetical protein